jgi:hypothetical protein
MLMERINAPTILVWSVVWRFDKPETYNPFIRSCSIKKKGEIKTGCVREVKVTTGLPAKNSVECLEILDEQNHVLSFKIMGVDHRLRDYQSVISLNEFDALGLLLRNLMLQIFQRGIVKKRPVCSLILLSYAIPIRTRLLDVKTEYSR